ncbi:arginase family protein [Nocardiopsis tropica]|jgi:arginase/N-omega-hydroxy-L-arginine amidinohydrolase|uniref:Arginase family protein n=1 Tax=Nocardiopsis tropica TaxID=109330 RepID=A0ABU7KSL5_9ACTN|nr:arginase family protein [Nocardiopsis umidischolae]MEE2052278.1 arginase family protein [Nocardiopsis umidischolae]
MIDIIVSQGRVADRKAGMIEGASLTARELERRYGFGSRSVGTPSPPADDDWSDSLPQAGQTLRELGRAVARSVRGENLPLVLANTCSASLATLPVVAREHPDAVVLYIDGHGDFNTPETTDTGYLGGMVLSAACGLWDSGHGAGLRPEQAVLVGARDIDETEGELLSKWGVRVIPPAEVTPQNVMAAVGASPVWVHIDWDVLEPGFVPADYEVPGGVLPEQLRAVFEAIPADRLLGIELAEFDTPPDGEGVEAAVSVILDIIAPVCEAARAR